MRITTNMVYDRNISSLKADLYEVIATLSKEDAALSATQLSFSKISKLTLFDYIR